MAFSKFESYNEARIMDTQDLSLIKNKIQGLIDKYKSLDSIQISKYTEEETKKGFIEPLFTVLGWDFTTKNEISAEESQLSGGRVDYGFYLEGRIKFYVEAKSLKSDLHNEEYAKQAIRYSWNKGVDWAVLTDFESIKIFYTQDPAQTLFSKLVFEIKFDEYIDRFDQLRLLSKEAFKANELDIYAHKHGKKLQKISVGDQLYKHLNECRKMLIEKLGIWNDIKDQELLDEGVQKLLDRLVFIRVAEDRGIEPPTLIPLLRAWESTKNGKSLYESMIGKFRELDNIYNSNLFTEHPFEKWNESPGVTEKVIETFRGKAGYYEYDFKVMPADVLGAVYENYLGHRLAASQKGIVLDKDSKKRKEQGIYYTPAFIVDYIVKNALKPVLDKCQSISDLKKIKVLDPACGSGSFLIKALEVINDKYKEFGNKGDEYTKITILLENIYGVDLDEQAVEIARLNLLLSALETKMRLPKLDKNIKNGNSLISGSNEELQKYFGKNFRDKKPFNWEEKFPEVFKQGGFNVIIGNPPYIFARENIDELEKKFYIDKYSQTEFKINTYILFIEKSFDILNNQGIASFIIPNNWLTLEMNSKFRKFVLERTFNISILNIKDKVFGSASVDNCILSFNKSGNSMVTIGEMDYAGLHDTTRVPSTNFLDIQGQIITYSGGSKGEASNICKKISSNSFSLSDKAEVKNGVQAYTVGEGEPIQTKEMKENRVYHSREKIDANWIKYVDGVDVSRYSLGWSGQFIKYGKNLSRPRRPDLFKSERILVRQIPANPPYSIHGVYTDEELINDNNSMIIKLKENHKEDYIFYILGLINSKLISFWFNYTFGKLQRKIFPQFKVNELARFPIYPADEPQQKVIIDLVRKTLTLKNDLKQSGENSNGWIKIKEEIEKTNRKIDEEVYKLYGLSLQEIAIVEGKNGAA